LKETLEFEIFYLGEPRRLFFLIVERNAWDIADRAMKEIEKRRLK